MLSVSEIILSVKLIAESNILIATLYILIPSHLLTISERVGSLWKEGIAL